MTERDRESRERDGREDGELKVTDRRLFNQDGNLREGIEIEDEEPTPPSPKDPPKPAAATPQTEDVEESREQGFERKPLDEPAGVDFTMLINGMAQPALLFLGEIPHPGTGQAQVDLEQAQLQIDMLQLLRVKCRGNLTAEEEGLLDRILYQLRMLYVNRSQQKPTQPPTGD